MTPSVHGSFMFKKCVSKHFESKLKGLMQPFLSPFPLVQAKVGEESKELSTFEYKCSRIVPTNAEIF